MPDRTPAGAGSGTLADPANGPVDLGLFGPGSVTWRVHTEPVLAVAGLRALFLQALHPRAIAAVQQNSGYQRDPWGRLLRTVEYVATVVYGTTEQAEAMGRRVRAVHARLRATDPDTGEPFRIDEPDLLRWVHVTEVESFLSTARRAGVRLDRAQADTYYDEQRRAAALVGLDPAEVPGSVAEVEDYYERVRPQLRITRHAAEAAVFLGAPPLPAKLGFTPVRGAYFGVAAMAIGLLPRWARQIYGLPGVWVGDLTATLTVRTLRAALAPLPRRFFEGPIYTSAMQRAALAAVADRAAQAAGADRQPA